MAHDIFDYKDGWEQDFDEDEVVDLEEEARKQRQELLAEQWRDGVLFVTTELVSLYENPTDPSPIICNFKPGNVILLSSLKDSSNYGGFRDVLLPVRGWVWTSIDEYDRAFHDASMMLRNVQTRDTSTSMQRLGKYVKRKVNTVKKSRSKRSLNTNTNNDSTEFFEQQRQHAFSDAELMKLEHHARGKTNHLYVNEVQREAVKKQKQELKIQSEGAIVLPDDSMDAHTTQFTPEPPSIHSIHNMGSTQSIEFSLSNENSSKYRRMSHQVRYQPAGIEKIIKPLSLEELEELKKNDDIQNGVFIEKEEEKVEEVEKKVEEEEVKKEEEEEKEKTLIHKIGDSRIVRQIIHFIRSNPALLTLIYIIFTAFVEGIIFFDLITDVMVAGALQSSSGMQMFFVISSVLIITPYFIAWKSIWGLIDKKRDIINTNHVIFGNKRRYLIFVRLFQFAPFGVILLIFFDLWIVFEFIVIRPIYFLLRFRLFRTDTFEELGYRKLRRVSEVCSESIFQAFVQLTIILAIKNTKNSNTDITVIDVTISLLASFFVIILWSGILRIESASNGMSLFEYLPIVLQGSFKFVPFLPAIEKGTKNGMAVNWCLFKFDLNALSELGRVLGAPHCKLTTIKVSRKTFKKLPRFGCKLFARLMHYNRNIEVIISRLDSDMEELFQLFDPQKTKYFNFLNFCRATLALRAQDNERLTYSEISQIFYELAASKKYELEEDHDQKEYELEEEKEKEKDLKTIQKVWLLDLMLKFRTSKQYISIIDIEAPEDYCVKQNDVNLLTFVRTMAVISDNHEKNVMDAVCRNKLGIAHCLTEDDGIPIVVEITEGRELLASYMNFHAPIDYNADKYIGLDNNDSRVTEYHRLNRLRANKNNNADDEDSNHEIFLNDIFNNDVSIYVAVSMCEQEKNTQTTRETINQFWNERLLFIVPYSVIDEIQKDATYTLQRETDHHEHFSDLYNRQLSQSNFMPIQLPKAYTSRTEHDNKSVAFAATEAYTSKTAENKSVAFAATEENIIEEEDNNVDESSVTADKYHCNTDTVVVVRQYTEDEEAAGHKTGLTQRLENLFDHAKKATMSSDLPPADIVPNESPHASFDNIVMIPTANNKEAHKKNKSSLLNPLLFSNPSLLHHSRGAESFVRHSLHLSKFARQSSIAPGMLLPHFEKKIYLDFNLFDDSANVDDEQAKSHKNKQSGGSVADLIAENKDSADDGGGEGTFLGSAHISINIDDAQLLSSYHEVVREKEIKIAKTKKSHKKSKQNQTKISKLKFKVYCNALSAYLKYGKNYGDKIREMQNNPIVDDEDDAAAATNND